MKDLNFSIHRLITIYQNPPKMESRMTVPMTLQLKLEVWGRKRVKKWGGRETKGKGNSRCLYEVNLSEWKGDAKN